jgi:hypothetical protein
MAIPTSELRGQFSHSQAKSTLYWRAFCLGAAHLRPISKFHKDGSHAAGLPVVGTQSTVFGIGS